MTQNFGECGSDEKTIGKIVGGVGIWQGGHRDRCIWRRANEKPRGDEETFSKPLRQTPTSGCTEQY